MSNYINIRRNVRPHVIVEKDMRKDDFVKYLLSMGFHVTTTKKGFVKNKSEYVFEINGNMSIHKAKDDKLTVYIAVFDQYAYTLNFITKQSYNYTQRTFERQKFGFDEFMLEMETK